MQRSLNNWSRLVELLALVTAPFVLLVAVVLFLDAGSGQTARAAARPGRAGTTHKIPTYDLTVVTDDQTGRAGYIAFVPTDLTVPSTRPSACGSPTLTAPRRRSRPPMPGSGWTVGGTIAGEHMMPGMPNMLYRSHTLRSLSAAAGVSHTFTSPGLHLNVPISPQRRNDVSAPHG